MKGPISKVYAHLIEEMLDKTRHPQTITPETVWQPANLEIRPYIHRIIEELLLPGSRIEGLEHLYALHEEARKGKSCLLLVEHYSNFDLPVLVYLLEKQGGERGRQVADAIVAIAGLKLNEANPLVKAFTEAYSRIVIYPSRSLSRLDPVKMSQELLKSRAINRAAMHELIRRKHSGYITLVFPAGTRYRPGKPETKRGVKEIDSYLRSFDLVSFVGIAGNILRINPDDERMEDDLVVEDKVVTLVSPPEDAQQFRSSVRETAPHLADKKQWVVDKIMERLEELHTEAEALRASDPPQG
ncbi:phospholipid/glycerol acyltransferase [Spirochaeta thermophila DSM 6578]|uniref:Phospholipid/glycerol acyltransferase n=1 Tax=Winmispira thermophila (strain ATCC 700085 / DSM 6578 / Z-1203) TaxID=869211 RepID=G0GDB9_WINT7|nr:1-acyl-sn-glycerol-3-phosphate acyltransferase [Spirochaeta thermophila]AEJ60545.1 phospholipid/glycerol acyltransferase [Spirochaeta thermophila DSM 6578]